MNERVWVKHGWTTIMCALVLLHVCLGQKDCTGVDCPHLDNCIEEVLEDGACCATCSQRGCICKGYQYYDCNSAGFKKGKVPEGESYLVDSGSTECWCPAGGGNISCRFIPCPDVPPHCIELSDSTEACSHCLRLGCVHHNHKYEAGHSFHMDPCQVCHCPNEGGELMCSVIPDCSSEMAKNPEVKKNELHVSKHEHPDDFLSEEHKLPSNSMPKYTENRSEFEEEEDYDYFPEATASPYTFVSSSATLQTQNPHEVLHEDTREELRETLGTYEVESRKEETEDSLNSPITETDSRSYQKLSQTETIARHTQVPPRKITTITTDDIQRTERNPDPYRDLHHTIPELNTLPKLQFISTTKPPVNVREREAHRQPQILGRYHQEGNGLHLTSNNQRVNSREIIMCCEAGENWASAHSHCNNMVPLRTDPGSTCWWAQRQCCSSSLRETQCSSGINTARRGRDCGADDPDLCDSYMECCMCCALGLQLQAQQQSCDPLQGLGVTCSHALLTCCEGTGSTNQSSVRERTHPQATSPPRKDSEGPEHQAFSLEEVEDTENMVEKVEGLEDVDECRVYAGQLCHHQCVNTQGSYVCVCLPGFVLQSDGIQCLQEVTADDEDGQIDASPKPAETSTTPPPGLLREPCEGNSHCAHHCHLVEGRDHCFCSPGFSLMPDGHSCEDIDECFLYTHSCQLHERCENTVGSFRCVQQIVCPSGYQLRNDLCEDIDECFLYTHSCQLHERCENTVGSFRCVQQIVCPLGYQLRNDLCEDIDECFLYTHSCQLHERCENTVGSFRCVQQIVCPSGYQLRNDLCEDIDECFLYTHSCQLHERCENTVGSFRCVQQIVCPSGYQLRNDLCEDINECILGAHSCGVGLDCINTAGSFSCRATLRCPGGFTHDSLGQCSDIDECSTVTQPCSSGFNCINTVGSYTCQRKIILCGRGYHSSPDGTRCMDTDECETGVHRCGEGQICHNIPGTYRCDCHPGYQYDMYRRTCADVNECWRYSGRLCAQTCENTPGSYRCSCNSGFTLSSDGKSCEDVNECLNSSCSHECVNVYGSYKCYCRQGYYLREDTHSCEDIDECSQSIGHLCAYKCVNIPGSYDCACPEHGYSMAPNRRSCHDIDECTVGAHNCTADETCYNVHGGFRCLSFSCPTNYRRASDRGCERISCSNYLECQNSPVRITYYQLSFQTNIIVPALIFRMGPTPAFSSDNVIISISSGNEDGYFSPRKLNAYTGAIYLQRQLPQPRDFLLDVEMKLWRQSTFTTFLARIYIFITANVV